MRDHPLRESLTAELHARPYARLSPPERATLIAATVDETGATAWRQAVAALCAAHGVPVPESGRTHVFADLGPIRIKWERHTEFVNFIVFRCGSFEAPFAPGAADALPPNWLDSLPGERIAAVHVAVLGRDAPEPDSALLAALFDAESLAASRPAGGLAELWTDFRIHADGFGHVLIRDRGMRARQAGRLVQRVLEIDTYTRMALLALPLARAAGPDLARIDRALAELTESMAGDTGRGAEEDAITLARLSALAAEVERISATTAFRFGAARAYYALIQERIANLREERREGYQTIHDFMDRRLAPAMRTCTSVAERQEMLARHLGRAADLLRTRVDIAVEAQNGALLRSMNRRAQLQLRLQQTVEGLSVAAITYYLVGLCGYVTKSLHAAGLPMTPDLVTGISIVPIALVVWMALRRVRRAVGRDAVTEPDLH